MVAFVSSVIWSLLCSRSSFSSSAACSSTVNSAVRTTRLRYIHATYSSLQQTSVRLCIMLRSASLVTSHRKASEAEVKQDSNRLETRGGVTFRASRPSTFAPSAPLVFLLLARVVAAPGFLQLVGAPLFMFSTLLFF